MPSVVKRIISNDGCKLNLTNGPKILSLKKSIFIMSIRFNLEKLLIKSVPILIVCFIFSIFLVSFGRAARWDLLEQIAMADNYTLNGVLHADAESDRIHTHSVYFPGVAYLAVALRMLGIDYYLVEVLLFIALTVLLLFLFVLSEYANWLSARKFSRQYFYPFLISYFTIVLPDYAKYALEFKPDTIALLMGYFGLSLVWTAQSSLKKYFFGIILISSALIFKQQFLAFLIGLFLSAFFVKKLQFRLATSFITIFSLLVLTFMIRDQNIRFWTVEVLSDDGIIPLNQLVSDWIKLLISFSLFLILFISVIAIDKINSITIPLKPLGFSKLFLAEPWYLVTLCVAGASFLSALKVGGNNGNTQVALAVMFPLFGLIANRLVYWKTILIAWFGLILFIQREIPDHLRNYRDALKLKSQVERLYFEDSFRILTGSDVYYASRFLMNEGVLLENYWTYSLMQNNDLSSSLVLEIESNYDYLIVENFLDNLNSIQESSKYEIIFVNSLGIIAKLKSSDLSQG